MEIFMQIIHNKYIWVPFFTWLAIQAFKVVWELITTKKFNFKRIMGAGGMPSSHSAIVMCIAVMGGKSVGFDTWQFALSIAFAGIVMYDAAGVRRAAGKQATLLNKIIETPRTYRSRSSRKACRGIRTYTFPSCSWSTYWNYCREYFLMKVVIIGGGPAGMMSAIESAKMGNEVILLEKNNKLGKKLLITGKGRCNITSSLSIEDFIKNVPGNGKFLYSAFNSFTNKDIISFLEEEGLNVKEERGNRIFPVTDKAQDVLNCFEKKLKKLNVKIYYNAKVVDILVNEENSVCGVKIEKSKKNEMINTKIKNQKETINTVVETIKADKVILATGGKSYPLTGSTRRWL